MYSITDLKKGTVVQIDGAPYKVVEYNQKQLGRGGSIVNTKLKNLIDGSAISKTFQGSDKVEPADVSNHKVQYLYEEGDTLHFMDQDSYDQFEINRELMDGSEIFMKEGSTATLQKFNNQPINIELDLKVPLEVTSAPDVVKGDTQSTVMKEVETETGAKVMTPIFIKTGDVIIVDTRDGSYVERQK